MTWNCNGAFRKKWGRISALDPDIVVIQECEDPSQVRDPAYLDWASNYLWAGPTKNKGIGVFAKTCIALTAVPLELNPLELFLPCIVDGRWPLLATWTRHANSSSFRYIGQLWQFLQIHPAFMNHPEAMLIGDLNSNAIWDKEHRFSSHSDVVRELSGLGLQSSYHAHFKEEQGRESKATFFLQRRLVRPYHIDYAFFGTAWTVVNVAIGGTEEWLTESDHMPMVVDYSFDGGTG